MMMFDRYVKAYARMATIQHFLKKYHKVILRCSYSSVSVSDRHLQHLIVRFSKKVARVVYQLRIGSLWFSDINFQLGEILD